MRLNLFRHDYKGARGFNQLPAQQGNVGARTTTTTDRLVVRLSLAVTNQQHVAFKMLFASSSHHVICDVFSYDINKLREQH